MNWKLISRLAMLALVVLPLSLGCSGGTDPIVLPADEVGMTPEQEAEYEAESMGMSNDKDAN